MAPDWERQYRMARERAGFNRVTGRSLTALSGDDSRSFLQGMVVSDIHGATPNSWTLSAMLNPKGRMVSDLALYNLADRILIEAERDLQGTVETTLRRYALRANLELRNQTEDWATIDISGPNSATVGPEPMQPGQVLSWEILGGRTVLARTDLPLQPTLRWLVPAGLEQAALDHLSTAGLEPIPTPAATALRMEAGIPVFGTDVGPDNLVLEVPLYRSGISFEKGCYVGQETVARLHARGENVARQLRGILTDQEPEPGTALEYRGKEVGSVSSTTWSPLAGKFLSLALVRRSAMDDGTVVAIGPLAGEVITLPLQDG